MKPYPAPLANANDNYAPPSGATQEQPPPSPIALGFDDLATRWRAPKTSRAAERRWVMRRVAELGLRPFTGTRGNSVRFRLVDVLRLEEKAARQ